MGNTIPLSARLMAVADVYDALIAERVYKPAYSHEQAVAIIRDGRGSHFDPDMVYAFLTLSEEFRRIAQQFADAEPRGWPTWTAWPPICPWNASN